MMTVKISDTLASELAEFSRLYHGAVESINHYYPQVPGGEVDRIARYGASGTIWQRRHPGDPSAKVRNYYWGVNQ